MRVVEEHPLESVATAAFLGFALGHARIAKRLLSLATDVTMLSSSRLLAGAIHILDKI